MANGTQGLKDVGLSFGIGANSLLKMAGDFYGLVSGDTENLASRQARENIEYLQRQKSPELAKAEEARRKAIDSEENELGKAWAYVRETVQNPTLLVNLTAETVPSMVGPGAAGAGARVAAGKLFAKGAETAGKIGVGTAVGTGAAMQGAGVGADQYQELVKALNTIPEDQAEQVPQLKELMDKGATFDEAKTALALHLARRTGLVAGAISAVSQMVPGGKTVERTIAGAPQKQVSGLLARGVGAAQGALGEATQEAVEEVGGQIAKNILAKPVEPGREALAGTGESLAQAALGAGTPGAAAGVLSAPTISRREPSPRPVPEGEATAGMSGQPPVPAATRTSLQAEQPATLERSEEMTPEQFWATVNVRQARLLGGEPNAEDVALVGPLDKIKSELPKWKETAVTTFLVGGPASLLSMYGDLLA